MLKWLGIVVALALLSIVAAYAFVCPCVNVPGGSLGGERVTSPVADWSFVNEVPLCQAQVDAGIPWSVNLNCMSSGGELYVSCSNCAEKRWSNAALTSPDGYLRAGDRVFPVRYERLTETGMLDIAWAARSAKLGRDPETPRPAHWWSFRLTSRS